ncbi:MAG: M48 family metalloprotease [Verrucomicrobiales bacterium]|nr:M48 family metalloprotease [Verrucomicrobiales bacterium]
MPTPADAPDHPDLATLTALRAGIRRPRVPFLYTVGLTLVAGAMVLLPLVYLALVGAMGYAVYWHATEHLSWFASRVGGWRFQLVKGFAYGALLLVGVVIVFFLLKPLFAKRPKRPQPLALHPGAEPRLYAFIEAICRAVGAPRPRRIDLDAQLNASASFRRGFLSFLGGDLVLTLGLPLVANLSVAELAGVVAHEFGHFTQGLAMRLGYVVARVNGWFARVVDERDTWDATLDDWAENPEDWRIGLVVWTAQMGVGLSRLFLRMLMYIGVALSGFLSRQMEIHADACEIRLAGSETFERTTRKFATLAAALAQTQQTLRQGWNRSGRLPDNLPELIRRIHDELPAATVARIQDTLGLGKTQWFHTHPCPAERIGRARRSAEPGILADDRPAFVLFEDFDVPARQVTELFYSDELGLPITSDTILPLAPRSPDPSEPSESAAPTLASIARPRPLRVSEIPSIDDTLLLGAPELLLPLPVPPLSLVGADDSTPPPGADPAALTELVSSLESVRSRVAELAAEARRLTIAAEAEESSGPDLSPLRHALHEVAEATARRLNLALNLATRSLDPSGRRQLQDLHDWIRAAHGEYMMWVELAARLPRMVVQVSQGALNGELPPPVQTAIDEVRATRSRLKMPPLISAPDSGKPRKLRIGPMADTLREIESFQLEIASRLASYRHALTELWAAAAPQETQP